MLNQYPSNQQDFDTRFLDIPGNPVASNLQWHPQSQNIQDPTTINLQPPVDSYHSQNSFTTRNFGDIQSSSFRQSTPSYCGHNQLTQQQSRASINQQGSYNCNDRNFGYQSNSRDLQSKTVKSPLTEFGDMGTAVNDYTLSSASKTSLNHVPKDLVSLKNSDTNLFRQQHGLLVWDDYWKGTVPDPFINFYDFPGIKDVQLRKFSETGFVSPTPIQAQTWPVAIMGRDIVSVAKTGSGKTLAFLLPAYHKIDCDCREPNKAILVLILAPTRELSVQILEESEKFGKIAGYNTAIAYGGAPKRDQLRLINEGTSVLIATPGRLNDFLDSHQIDISSVLYLVMDEADRMLDMGFEPQIRSILKRLPRKRQTLMFSATWPEEVRRLANDFLHNPIHIRLGDHDNLQANENIHQYLIPLTSAADKDNETVKLIRNKIRNHRDNVLLFVARKNTCNFVANMLTRCGIHAAAMHGDRTQDFREETLAKFKDGSLPVLVATDVASRGLDVQGLTAVVNYDIPGSAEDYVHRIGRTGRAGASGESYTFVSRGNEDVYKVQSIVEIMKKTNQLIPVEIQQLVDDFNLRKQRNDERRAAEDDQFEKVLLVAEKPSVAKMIAESLSQNGRYRTRKGKSRANQIFEIIKYFSPAQKRCKIMITSVVGHIFGLNFENQRVHDIATLFDAPVKKIIEDTSKKLCIVEHLQELANESQYLYLWLDCDREGENIGFEVISLAQKYIIYDNVYRARFSSLTKTDLNFAYENPIRPDKYAALSVDARQELDLKIGVAFTRLMTRTYLDQAKQKFRLKDQKCVSYGPCQTPTLWFCAKRHREIQQFQSQKYYLLTLNVNVHGKKWLFKFVNEKVKSDHEVQQIQNAVQRLHSATVVEVRDESKMSHKPVGLNTVTLLKACSKGLGMSPTAAMNAAEHLYTSGLISYPRTETTAYSPKFDLVSVLREQANSPGWGRSASFLLQEGRISPPSGGHDAGDHPPITPMRAANRQDMKPNEWKIYDYITRHFIASLHNNFHYTEHSVVADVGGYQFKFISHTVNDRGYTLAMPWKERDLKLNETQMPPNRSLEGRYFGVDGLNIEEDFTKPPDYLQECELISLMDKHGIGTDASIPQHIKNIQERHYVDVCGPGVDGQKGAIIPVKKFFGKNSRGRGAGGRGAGGRGNQGPASRHMVPRGFGLAFLSCFENLDAELCEPTIRGYMEEQITKIATGETEKTEVVSSNLNLFKNKFINFRQNLSKCDRYFGIRNEDGGMMESLISHSGPPPGRGGGPPSRGGPSYRRGTNRYDAGHGRGGSNIAVPHRGVYNRGVPQAYSLGGGVDYSQPSQVPPSHWGRGALRGGYYRDSSDGCYRGPRGWKRETRPFHQTDSYKRHKT